jgi:hypothetical protein
MHITHFYFPGWVSQMPDSLQSKIYSPRETRLKVAIFGGPDLTREHGVPEGKERVDGTLIPHHRPLWHGRLGQPAGVRVDGGKAIQRLRLPRQAVSLLVLDWTTLPKHE